MAIADLHSIHEKKQFEKIFREFFPGLILFAKKYVHDDDSVRDICHQVFINVWEKRESIDFSTSLKSYLFTSTYNRCMNFLRDNKKFDTSELTAEKLENTRSAEFEDALVQAENEQEIYAAIQDLPEKCREIFILNRFDSKKYAEIAETLNISVKTVEAQMTKALKILRDKLAKYLHLILWILIKIL